MSNDLIHEIDQYYHYWFGINALYESWAKKYGLTSNALFTLYVLHTYPIDCTQRFICEKLLLPKQTVNTILDGFEKKGYLLKKTMLEDRRNKRILLTETGQRYANELLAAMYRFEERALFAMRPEQRMGMIENTHIFLEQLSLSLHEEDTLL